MNDFAWQTAMSIFFAYFLIDMMYAWYIIAVGRRRAFTAAMLTAGIYSLLAYGVLSYSKCPLYLVPLASGAFCGTYITVKFKR